MLVTSAANLTMDRLFQLEDEFKRLKPTKIPLCIIKYGPPGSGKSSADEYIKDMFHIDLDNFTKIDKDVPLIAIREFRKGSIDIYKGVKKGVAEAVQTFQDQILNEPNHEGLSINDKMPVALQRAFDLQFNVLWETTGQSARSQELMESVFRAIPKVYRIIVLYPIVSESTALARVRTRARSHLKEEPPYFRPVPVERVKAARVAGQRYFTERIVPLVLDGTIYQLFCYNNEGRPDSRNYTRIRPGAVAKTRKRVARGWRFGLRKRKRLTARAEYR